MDNILSYFMSNFNTWWEVFITFVSWLLPSLAAVLLIWKFWDKIKILFSSRLTNVEKIKKRIELRREFEKYLVEKIWKNKYRNDVIIMDVKRIDESYPEIDESNKISSWFKLWLLGT